MPKIPAEVVVIHTRSKAPYALVKDVDGEPQVIGYADAATTPNVRRRAKRLGAVVLPIDHALRAVIVPR